MSSQVLPTLLPCNIVTCFFDELCNKKKMMRIFLLPCSRVYNGFNCSRPLAFARSILEAVAEPAAIHTSILYLHGIVANLIQRVNSPSHRGIAVFEELTPNHSGPYKYAPWIGSESSQPGDRG